MSWPSASPGVATTPRGIFDTPMLLALHEEVSAFLGGQAPHPEPAPAIRTSPLLAEHVVANPMLSGETIRLDGGIRRAGR